VNAFHVIGGLLAAWALLVSFLGVTRENWPTSKGTERIVILISVTLFVCAVSSAVLTALAEHHKKEREKRGGEHALVLPV
jgi:flagellar basal body-associated protein FliL